MVKNKTSTSAIQICNFTTGRNRRNLQNIQINAILLYSKRPLSKKELALKLSILLKYYARIDYVYITKSESKDTSYRIYIYCSKQYKSKVFCDFLQILKETKNQQ